ncbi:MAG: FAD-dependent oxidoreductase [Lentisphaeria bacterium]|nr:FAD-dependent oxidoreductase [Lentisphaeria bacterium]
MKRYDVIVAGGGTAGVFAALAAAGDGMSVLMLEKTTACGGIGTNGAVAPYYDRNDLRLSAELDAQVLKQQTGSGFLLPLKDDCAAPELLKGAFENALKQKGVRIIYQAVVTGVCKDGSRVTGVSWHDPAGNHTAGSGAVIDATGDGTLLFLAGAEFLPANEMEHACQPYARIFTYCAYGRIWNYGGDAGYTDPADPENFSAECLRSAAAQLPERFEETEKRFCYAPVPGIREGRHLRGRQTIRFSEVIRGIQHPEPVAWEYANFDTHTVDLAFEADDVFLFSVAAMQWSTGMNIAIPAGALIPEGVDGIIAAGRMLSADHAASQAVRMKGCMKHLGAVAGIMAASAVKNCKPVAAVHADEITARFPLPPAGKMLQDNENLRLKDPEEIKNALRRKNPGTAIWSAYLLGQKEYLYSLLDEPDFAGTHAAFALAILQDKSALAVLRELARRRDMTKSETGRNEPLRECHGAIAVYLLGFLDDTESFSLLQDIFMEKKDFFFTVAAWRSILRLSSKHPHLLEPGRQIIRQFVDSADSIPCFNCYCGEVYDATGKMKNLSAVWLKQKIDW